MFAKNNAETEKIPYGYLPPEALKSMSIEQFFEYLKREPTDPIVLDSLEEKTKISNTSWPKIDHLEYLVSLTDDKTPCSHIVSSIDPDRATDVGISTIGDQAVFMIYGMSVGRNYPMYSSDDTLSRMNDNPSERQEIIEWAKSKIWWKKFWNSIGF